MAYVLVIIGESMATHFEIVTTALKTQHADLTGGEKAILVSILNHYNRKSGKCYPSLNRLSLVSGFSTRTILRAIKSLQEKGYLFYEQGHTGTANEYGFIWTKIFADSELEGLIDFTPRLKEPEPDSRPEPQVIEVVNHVNVSLDQLKPTEDIF